MSDILAVQKGDYVIAESTEFKEPVVLKISGADGIMATGVSIKYQNIPNLRKVIDVKQEDIFLNLGPNPRKGRVYGLDVSNLYKGSVDHKNFGRLCWMYKPQADTKTDILRGFSVAYKKLAKFGLEFLADEDIVWEINPANGERYAGMYIPAKKTKSLEVPARIMLRPEVMTADLYPYVVIHELGHHVHRAFLKSPKLEAAWIKLFNTSIKPQDIDKTESAFFLDTLLAGEERPSVFRKSLEEEQQVAFKWIIRHISQTHGITMHELDLLFEGDEREEIRALWPTRTIQRKELDPVISEYATKNFRETIAEAFALHLTGTQLPKAVIKLVERTISYAKAQSGKGGSEEE